MTNLAFCRFYCYAKIKEMKNSRKNIFLLALVLFFSGLFLFAKSKPAQARIAVGDCETTQQCIDDSGDPRGVCDNHVCLIPSTPIPESSLEKFQTIVKQSEKSGETNLQWYFGSDNGTIEATTNSLTGLIVGNDIDWDQLHAGNFGNARIGGAFGFTTNLVAQVLTQPPVSSREYFADLGKNFGLAKPAYAQGVGFSGLSNLLPLWKASRNLAYIFFIIAFLYIGLAIMFRVKISPQAVVSIQNALPKLIIALILVTFSYAIVGLMIDLIYVLIYVGVLAIGQTGWINVAQEQAKLSSLSFGEGMGLVFGGGVTAVTGMVGGWFSGLIITAILGIVGVILATTGVGAVVAALPLLILGVIALFCIFKLFFALLGCYIQIILAVIIGPIQIAMGAIPGSQGGFGSWLKNLMANILVFPAVALFLLLGWLLTKSHGPTWTPPVIASSGEILTPIIGFGMLLLLPKIPEIIKNAFKMKPAGYGAAIGEAVGAPKMLLGKAIGLGSTVATINKSYGEITGTQEAGLLSRLRRRPGGSGSVVDNLPG